MIRNKTELRNYKYDIRIISTHQGLVINGKIEVVREILEAIYISYFETAEKFYQNPLNRVPQDNFVQIINLFEANYEEPVEISKEKLIEKSKLKNWYQSQSNDSKATLFI